MKLFQPLRKVMPFLVGYDILEEYGFVAPNQFQKYLCCFTSLFGYVVLVSATTLMSGFLIFEAENFQEIHNHFYEFATGFNDTIYFVYIHWMCGYYFSLNDKFEQITTKSKFFLNFQNCKIKTFFFSRVN